MPFHRKALYWRGFFKKPGVFSLYKYAGTLQTEPFKDKRIVRKDDSSPFELVAYHLDHAKHPLEPADRTDLPAASKPPDGWFDFVILHSMPGTLFARRERQSKVNLKHKKDPGTARGHTSISRGLHVIFAGELLFGGDPKLSPTHKPGELVQWTNKSGHYRVGHEIGESRLHDHVARQTALLTTADGKSPLLPIELFNPWNGDL